MAAMGQNSGSELCAFVKIGDPNDLADILGLDAETRVIQNWELDRLQNLCVADPSISFVHTE